MTVNFHHCPGQKVLNSKQVLKTSECQRKSPGITTFAHLFTYILSELTLSEDQIGLKFQYHSCLLGMFVKFSYSPPLNTQKQPSSINFLWHLRKIIDCIISYLYLIICSLSISQEYKCHENRKGLVPSGTRSVTCVVIISPQGR
jgi:hypothetical protein